jgi:hypothetical protein
MIITEMFGGITGERGGCEQDTWEMGLLYDTFGT